MKLNSNCDETQKLVMKVENSNCDETQKTQIIMKLKNTKWNNVLLDSKFLNKRLLSASVSEAAVLI